MNRPAPLPVAVTPLTLHRQSWSDCQRCKYSQTRRNVVIGKGSLPCDIFFCGEAPGDSEDDIGAPFVGQAGKVLDVIVLESGACDFRRFYGNLLGCVPRDPETREKETMEHECLMTCKPRLEELIAMAAPKLIVAVGKEPAEYLDQTWREAARAEGIPQVHIQHPASILRAPFVQRRLMVQKCVVTVRNGIRDHVRGKI